MAATETTTGFDSPSGLSPSRIDLFTKCRRAYRFRYVEGREDPPTLPAVRGSLVHRVLEDLFTWPPRERTLSNALAQVPVAWSTVLKERPEYREVRDSLDTTDEDLFKSAEDLLRTYFDLEDPTRLRDTRQETAFDTRIGDVPLRGIVDRTDVAPGSGIERITDYKSGKAPAHDRGVSERMHQLKMYALARYAETGTIPAEVRLMFLGEGGSILTYTPSVKGMEIARKRLHWLWDEVTTAHTTGEFPASPQPLCAWCPFTDLCPEGAEAADEYRDRKALRAAGSQPSGPPRPSDGTPERERHHPTGTGQHRERARNAAVNLLAG